MKTYCLLAFLLSSLPLVTVALVSAQNKNYDDTVDHFEFIYHQTKNLLLAVHGGDCYFISVENTAKWRLDFADKHDTEVLLKAYIQLNDSKHIHPSSLDDVRNTYQDLLADFHCLHKQIFVVTE
eukprot:GHVL01004932.1.p1 GENE.GHVL01004932.1~~GHVL01004932.1.p1  ORF type:complete len:124 (-),score=3.24 GHVL01004932.1:76-447(-)